MGFKKDTFKIDIASQDLLQEAIRTLPSEPQYVEITFAAGGVALPYNEEGEEEKYISKCSKNDIIPFSNIKLGNQFEHGQNAELFAPYDTEGIVSFDKDYSEQSKKAIIQGLIKGGKIHLIEIEINLTKEFLDEMKIPANNLYQKFKDEFLDTMLNNNYQIKDGDLWLISRRVKRGYATGDYRDSGLMFGRDGHGEGLELQLDEQTPDEDKNKLIEWFNQLAKKYKQSINQNK